MAKGHQAEHGAAFKVLRRSLGHPEFKHCAELKKDYVQQLSLEYFERRYRSNYKGERSGISLDAFKTGLFGGHVNVLERQGWIERRWLGKPHKAGVLWEARLTQKALAPRVVRTIQRKLTAQQVVEIRRDYKAELPVRKALAARYGVRLQTIDGIASGRTWKHVQPAADDNGQVGPVGVVMWDREMSYLAALALREVHSTQGRWGESVDRLQAVLDRLKTLVP